MERFWCYAMGFFVALLLVIVFLIVKNEVEKYKEKVEHRVNQLAEAVFYEELQKVMGYYPCTLGDFVDKRIDHKLAEKEVEHEDN